MIALARSVCLTIVAAIAISHALPARGDSVADFYKGKQMQMLIGFGPGGNYDRYARTIAQHWGRLISGHPSFVARNVPGASTKVVTNQLYNVLPKDGTVVAAVSRGIVHEELWGGKGVKFKSTKLNWIGSANNVVGVCVVWHTAPVTNLRSFLSTNLVFASTGPGGDSDAIPRVLNNLFDAKIKRVSGYQGGGAMNLAIERGEVQGRCGWSWGSVVSTRSQWLQKKKIKVMLQYALTKHPDHLDVPLMMDLARNDRERKILELILARQTMGRPYVSPPAVPVERLKALRSTFMKLMKDESFLKDAKKMKLEINPVGGEEVQRIVASMFAAPQDVIEASKQAVK